MARPENHQTSYRKLSMVGKKSFAVSLPVEAIRQLNWKKGDTVLVRRQGDKIVIQRKEES